MKEVLKNKYFWIAVVAGLILGDLIGVMIAKDPEEIVSNADAATSTALMIVSDQAAGEKVVVEKASSESSAWLAVRENNGELLGRILGAQRIDPGSWEYVAIDLLRPTTPNLMYAVVMYVDDGDGLFDNKLDTLVLEGDMPQMARFVAR